MNLAKLARAAGIGLLVVGALGACTSDDSEAPTGVVESSEATDSPGASDTSSPGAASSPGASDATDGDAASADGSPSPEEVRSYVEATTAYDTERLEEARQVVVPGSPADQAIDFYLANIDLAETQGATLPTLERHETDGGWQVCWTAASVDDCSELTNFRGVDGKLVSHDVNGTSLEGNTLVGDRTPAAEDDWGSVTLRVADIGSGSLYVIIDIQAADVAVAVRNGEVAYRTAGGEELEAAMTTKIAGDIEPGQTATFGISIDRATELAGEVEVSLRTVDGGFEGEVVVPIEE